MRNIITLVVFCILLVVTRCAFAGYGHGHPPQDEDYGEALYLANNASDAFTYCGVNWLDLDEKCESSNYNHYRSSTKRCYIAMFKPPYEGDRYFIVGKEDDYWIVRRKHHEENGVYSLPWGVYKIFVDDENHPTTKLFNEMLYEFIEEILGAHCPSLDKDEEKITTGMVLDV